MHLNRKRRHGSYLLDTPPGLRRTTPLAERFWKKVNRTEGCWLWTAGVTPQGYGTFGLGRRGQDKTVAHRVAYELTNGPIPLGLMVDHACGIRRCVNPAHLRLATAGDNAEHRVAMVKANKSGYRGVSWHKQTGKWSAQVTHRGKKHHLGLFDDPAEAARTAASKRAELFTFPDFPIHTNRQGELPCQDSRMPNPQRP